MDNEKLKNIIKDLSNNVMFSLSLTSKELFHSNLWAWLGRKYPKMFTEIFLDEKVELDENSIILREYKNFDLYVETKNSIYVFENKCKSMPNKSQLMEYDKKLAKIKEEKEKEIKTKLISYFEPIGTYVWADDDNPSQEHKWSIITYNELYNKFKNSFKNNKEIIEKNEKETENNDKIIIEEYIKCLELLNNLQNSIELNDGTIIEEYYSLLDNDEIKKLSRKINFEKTLERILVNKLTHYVLDKYEKKDEIDAINIDCGRDHVVYSDILFYFKGAWVENEDKRPPLNAIGVSLWGKNFRYYANVNKSKKHLGDYLNSNKDNLSVNDWKNAGHKYLSTNYKDFWQKETEKTKKIEKGGYNCKDDMWLYKKEDISKLSISKVREKTQYWLNEAYGYLNLCEELSTSDKT